MPKYTYPLILGLLVSLSGCSTVSRLSGKTQVVYRPVEVPVVVKEYIALPDGLLSPCVATHGISREVKEYVRVANTNTPRLVQCGKQIEEIRKLQPPRKQP